MANFVKPYKNDPFVGHLSTPITTSAATRAILGNLPAYRGGLSSLLRGLEIGMAHGYFLVGPFTILGPLRNSEVALLAGFLSAIGLICILGVALTAYGSVTFTGTSEIDTLQTKTGWEKFTGGFMVGAFGGAGFAFLLLNFL
uniref:Photosystem I reaction center subunit XI n=1 Tax=Rhizochromulina marina TaxID=1034831 RepID=A0A514CPX3_9STRA|nr:photosystem I subunit XI [Rhizochromulina marina]QDH81851.1 photosystem I subunit XI [Rhizochromulina marina]